jgi:hypothetical protein
MKAASRAGVRMGIGLGPCAMLLTSVALTASRLSAQEAADVRYGLTQAQWTRYETLARCAVTNAAVWKQFSVSLPPGLQVAADAIEPS